LQHKQNTLPKHPPPFSTLTQYPSRNSVVTKFAVIIETPKSFEMPTTLADGDELAKVALVVKKMATTVMYHRRPLLQFLGFSISSGPKSTLPFLFRCTCTSVILADRYGLAVGRESVFSSRAPKEDDMFDSHTRKSSSSRTTAMDKGKKNMT
jgi:hypothetical protein